MARRVSPSNVLAVVLALCVGRFCGEPGDYAVATRVDSVPPAAFSDSLRAMSLEAEGWRALFADMERTPPKTILRTDTFVTPPDTVLQLVALKGTTLSLAPLIHADSLWAPELHRYEVSACDDGWSWNAGALACDRARLGHLSPFVRLGASAANAPHPIANLAPIAEAGIEWTPSYRSGWRASVGTDLTGLVALTITRKWAAW